MSLSVRIERDPQLMHIENGLIWLSAADAQGEAFSVTVPLADWSYLNSAPRNARDPIDPHHYALTQIEDFMLSSQLEDVPSSRHIKVVMTDRI
jgi:hypothetical protein